uniref:Uncharacterized protein n=1 Tax=Alexandrium catenella TaxID=2925 RepID=A0A7S1WU15_ALECA
MAVAQEEEEEEARPGLGSAGTEGSSFRGSPFFPQADGHATDLDTSTSFSEESSCRELQCSRSAGATLRSSEFRQRAAAAAEASGASALRRVRGAALRTATVQWSDGGSEPP